jgi:tryptophan 2-monooxygenase
MKDNSFLRIATSDAYHFGNGDFTLEAWIKPFSPGTIFGKKSSDGGSSDCAGFLLVLQPNGSIKLATDNGYGYYQTISDASNIFNGDWHHIAGVRSNGALSLYVDGQPIRSTASGSLPSPLNVSNDLPLLIGSVQQHQETYIHYSGALSEVRLWKVALQRSLIQQVMNSKLTGSEAGLVGYWPLRSNGDDLSPNKNRACPAGNVSFGDN